jgi:hypothetical protein
VFSKNAIFFPMQSCLSDALSVTMSHRNQHYRSEPEISLSDTTEASVARAKLENAVYDIAANGGASTKDGGIAHFLAEFFPILLQLAGLSAFCGRRRAGLADSQRHVAVIGRW